MDTDILEKNLKNPDTFVKSFEDGRYPVLLKDNILQDKKFIKYIDVSYNKEQWFVDDDYDFLSEEDKNDILEELSWAYIYIIQNWELLIAKKLNSRHSDLAQWENIEYWWEVFFLWWHLDYYTNWSWHYKPLVDWKDIFIEYINTMWYDGNLPNFIKE